MKLLICIATAGLVSMQCLAQDDTSADSVKSKSTITAGIVYCTNADYYGQTAQQKLSYVAAALSYRHKSGFYLTGLGYKLLNDTSNQLASATNLSAGISFKLGPKLSADISYNHTFYPASSPFLQAGNADNASLSLSYEGWVKPSLGADYAFGKTPDIFTTAGLSKEVNLGSISPKDLVSITPAVSVVGGTQHYYQTYITQKKLADSLLGILFTPVTGDPPGSSSFTKTITTFNILSYNFKLPVDYSRAHYMVEASCQFSLLGNHSEAGPGKLNSFINLGFYYQF
jgi:hypothetical protein